jgi:predicted N-acetyltransferase YhbS
MRMPERCPLPAIRKATQADSAKILECLRAAFEPYRSSYTPEAFADTVLTPEVLQHRLATMCLFVAVSDSGEIVGTIGCHVVHPSGHSASHSKQGHFRGMAVLPAWQGSGVASRLLKSVEAELRHQGCSRISLNTTEPLRR